MTDILTIILCHQHVIQRKENVGSEHWKTQSKGIPKHERYLIDVCLVILPFPMFSVMFTLNKTQSLDVKSTGTELLSITFNYYNLETSGWLSDPI